jgi:glycosyltransferase involved in cell wall biosynthesis
MTGDLLAGQRLCHVNLAAGYRGGERQTQLLIEQFAARGYSQRLVARRGGELARRCAGIAGLDVRETSSSPLAAAWATRGSDILHAHEARAIYACWLGALTGRARWLLTRRVDNPFKSSPVRNRAYRDANALVAVSRAIKDQVEAFYPGERCTVVADAHADLARSHAGAGELRTRFAGKTVVGHIGALDHSHKGQGTIIAAAKLAAERHPELHFVLVGDGRDEQVFRKAADGLENLEFTGFVNEVDDWLSVFDLFVFPSLHEGLGSILLDAMSFGLPIVASRVGGIPDIVDNGVNGLLIEPQRPNELLAAVRRLQQDRSMYDAMRRANLAKADAYSPAAMADRYAAVYRKILKS